MAAVTFTHNASNLPPMIATSSLATTVLRQYFGRHNYRRGARDWQECSHRGICDTMLGFVTVSLDGPAATVGWEAIWHLVNVAIAP